MLEHMSDTERELFLWDKGSKIHQMSSKERSALIKAIYSDCDYLSTTTINHFVGYVMHSFFYNMSVSDKGYIIKLLIEDASFETWGEKVEMLGILYKDCPRDMKTATWDYIYYGAKSSINKETDCIAFCNAVRYIFDEMSRQKQALLYKTLLDLNKRYQLSPVAATIDYTLNNVSKIMR